MTAKNALLKNKVSVIIPTYNRAWIIKKAIESVLSQSYSNIELIVINDGSTDNTNDIIKNYGSQIISIDQKNQGVSRARNAGIKAATGNLIAFLDSDDWWLKSKISEQVNFFKKNPDALICQTNEIWIKHGKKINQCNRHKKPSGMIFEKSLELCLVSPSAVMLRKSIFEKVGYFDEKLPVCEDYDLWLRISYKYPIFLVENNLVVKTGGHIDQLSRRKKLDKFRIMSIFQIIKSGKLSYIQRKAAVKVLKKKCNIYVSGCLKRNKYQEARKYINIAKTIS